MCFLSSENYASLALDCASTTAVGADWPMERPRRHSRQRDLRSSLEGTSSKAETSLCFRITDHPALQKNCSVNRPPLSPPRSGGEARFFARRCEEAWFSPRLRGELREAVASSERGQRRNIFVPGGDFGYDDYSVNSDDRVLNGSTELTKVLLRVAPNKPATSLRRERLWQSSVERSVESFESPACLSIRSSYPRSQAIL